MKKKIIFIAMAILGFQTSVCAQYFYNDILSVQQSQQQYLALRKQKIKEVSAASFEPDGKLSPGFLLQQTISEDGRLVITRSAIAINTENTSTHQYVNSRLRKSVINGKNIETKVDYVYDEQQRVQKISTQINDTATRTNQTEMHEWFYTGRIPAQMLCIKNKVDTLTVLFTTDSLGLVLEENWFKKNKKTATYYYYYNSNNQLTDIVRYNARAKQLLPDYVFEYDDAGKLIEMRQMGTGPGTYQIWTYEYNEWGLKAKEVCYNKQKAFLGKIIYSYVKYSN